MSDQSSGNPSFPKFPSAGVRRVTPKPDPSVSTNKPKVSFMPNIPVDGGKKPIPVPQVAAQKQPVSKFSRGPPGAPPGMYRGGSRPGSSTGGPAGNRFAPRTGPASSSTSTWTPNVLPPNTLSDAPEPPKRKPKTYNQLDIAPTAQSMSINPLDTSHPITLPFLDPHKANPALLNQPLKNVDSDMMDTDHFDKKPSIHDTKASSKDKKASVSVEEAEERDNPANMLFKGERGTFEGEDQLFFIQMPSALPIGPVPSQESLKIDENSILGFNGSLASLPTGQIGKLLLYKSGKVKLKIGDVLLDVSTGMPCNFLQEVVLLSPEQKKFYQLGDVSKRMVCYPDVGALLQNSAENESNEMLR